ncbi:MAG: phage major capsid protein [Candidatus Paceibacterota bacterium]|jgi:HK97 family phage major capsid protein
MSEEIKKLIEDQGRALESFRIDNEKRLKDLEAKGTVDPLLEDKVKKIAEDVAAIATMKTQLESIEAAVAKMQAPGGGTGEKKKSVYSSIGQQLLDVVAAVNPDLAHSSRAEAIARLGQVRADAASGANELIPSEGGFLVETDKATMLDRGTIATGLLSQRCFNVPCSANSNSLTLNLVDETSRATGSRFGGIQVYMKAEADTVTASKPKFREGVWKLKDCMGIFYATGDVLKDSSQLTAVVNRWFPAEFGFKIDDEIIRGVGAGHALGVLNAPCTVSQAVETGQGTRASNVQKILYENVVRMYARLLSSSDPSAVWFINRALLPDIMLMTLTGGTAMTPVFLPPNGAAGQPYMTLLGKPIIPIEQCEAPGTAGDILLADLGEYLLLTKGGIEAASSIHVRFLYDEMTFRWIYRFDGGPIRNKVLTPYKGSSSTNTQGPFVTLAAS